MSAPRESAFRRAVDQLGKTQKIDEDKPDRHAKVQCPLPGHPNGDQDPSLKITRIQGGIMLFCHCAPKDTYREIAAWLGWSAGELLHDDPRGEMIYPYSDGRKVHRWYDKQGVKRFAQRGNTDGQRSVLFHLERLTEARSKDAPIFLVPSEKDVLALESLATESIDVFATCAPQGEGNFGKVDLTPLYGAKEVIAIAHNDKKGEQWARDVIFLLEDRVPLGMMKGKIDQEKADVADHIAAGYSLAELVPWVPPPADNDQPEPEPERTRLRFVEGDRFFLDIPPDPIPIWGRGKDVLQAEGEALMITGPQGTGKTAIALQVAFGRLGIPGFEMLFDLPIMAGSHRVLYLAMDRPQQIARSGHRMITPEMRELLRGRLLVWRGPPPFDLAMHPSMLTDLCDEAEADTVIVDSLKDAALKLSDDETGAAYNRGRQMAIESGVQVIESHHLRKALQGVKAQRPSLEDVYGSTWLSAGTGSVVLLNGSPGDAIIDFHHLKQPVNEVGPFKIHHDSETGRSKIWHSVDLVELARDSETGISAPEAAAVMFEKAKPTPSEIEKARRRLIGLERSGFLWVYDKGDRTRQTRWKAAERSTEGSTVDRDAWESTFTPEPPRLPLDHAQDGVHEEVHGVHAAGGPRLGGYLNTPNVTPTLDLEWHLSLSEETEIGLIEIRVGFPASGFGPGRPGPIRDVCLDQEHERCDGTAWHADLEDVGPCLCNCHTTN